MSRTPTPTLARLRKKVAHREDGCIVFTGYLMVNGYGTILHRGEKRLVHRVAYELAYGLIPDEAQIHHRCGTRACVNPEHLEALGSADHAAEHRPESCIHGHPFDEANTRVIKGKRHCRACDRDRQAAYRLAHPGRHAASARRSYQRQKAQA